jgi:hypothetical protein
MNVCNPDCSTFAIYRRDTAPTPSGFAQIVSDDFPVLHAGGWILRLFVLHTATTKWLFASCQVAAFSDKLPSMEQEIDCKMQSNSR